MRASSRLRSRLLLMVEVEVYGRMAVYVVCGTRQVAGELGELVGSSNTYAYAQSNTKMRGRQTEEDV